MKTTSNTFFALVISAGLIGASGALAQSATEPAQGEAAAAQQNMQGMMGGGDMNGMMGMMNMMAQMNEMMQACTKMMQAMTPESGTPEQQGNPG